MSDEEDDDRPFQPDWYSPTGHTVESMLRTKKLSADDFAAQIGETPEFVAGLLAGTEAVSADLADRLARVLGATPGFWSRRDAQYWEARARVEAKRAAQEPE